MTENRPGGTGTTPQEEHHRSPATASPVRAPREKPAFAPGEIYQRIGEVVVCFQWIENLLCQIHWTLTDPNWEKDPRRLTADLWFKALVDSAHTELLQFAERVMPQDPGGWIERAPAMFEQCKALAIERNKVVHSAYVELKAGGELVGLLRSDMAIDRESGELKFDQDHLTSTSFGVFLRNAGELGIQLGLLHKQIIHWLPATRSR